jgi:hypothetical protein
MLVKVEGCSFTKSITLDGKHDLNAIIALSCCINPYPSGKVVRSG